MASTALLNSGRCDASGLSAGYLARSASSFLWSMTSRWCQTLRGPAGSDTIGTPGRLVEQSRYAVVAPPCDQLRSHSVRSDAHLTGNVFHAVVNFRRGWTLDEARERSPDCLDLGGGCIRVGLAVVDRH